jgi:hypothetical protein
LTAKRSLISPFYTPNHPQRDRRGCDQPAREPYQETGGRFSDRAIPVTMSSHLFPPLGALSTEPCRRVLGCAPLPSHVLVMTGADPERWLGNAHKPLGCQFSALSQAAEVLKAWSVYTSICTCSSLPLRLSSDGPRLLAWSTNLLAACSDRPGPPTDVPLNARPPGEGCESQEEQSRIIRRTAVFTGSHQPMPILDPPYSAPGSF